MDKNEFNELIIKDKTAALAQLKNGDNKIGSQQYKIFENGYPDDPSVQ